MFPLFVHQRELKGQNMIHAVTENINPKRKKTIKALLFILFIYFN